MPVPGRSKVLETKSGSDVCHSPNIALDGRTWTPWAMFSGTSQATGGSLQPRIGGAPLPGSILAGHWGELFQAKFGSEDEVMNTT